MNILVTGANGQLGVDLVNLLSGKSLFQVIGLSKEELDVTDQESVNSCVEIVKPDVIVHCGAYTRVDQAEANVDMAYLINGVGTRNLTIAAQKNKAKICYISTDYVFNGQGRSPYHEYDIPNPLGVYGKSKYAGEEFVKSFSSTYFIVRTSWLYGFHGNNFVKTMIKLGNERDEMSVVDDQRGSPTYTVDLANFLIELIQTEKYGIYHASNTGECSWYHFANAIFEEAGISVKVKPISTLELQRPAKRPEYSVLDHISLRINGFNELRHWREALREFIKQHYSEQNANVVKLRHTPEL